MKKKVKKYQRKSLSVASRPTKAVSKGRKTRSRSSSPTLTRMKAIKPPTRGR